MNNLYSHGRLTATLLCLFVLAGCVRSQAIRLDPTERPRLSEDQVRVYRTLEQIQCDYTEVALIQTQGDADYTSQSKAVNVARGRAARLGANGLVLREFDEPDTVDRVANAAFGTGTIRRGDLLAVFVEPCQGAGSASTR